MTAKTRSTRRGRSAALFFILAVLFLCGLVLFSGWLWAGTQRIFPGVKVGDLALGGKTGAEAERLLVELDDTYTPDAFLPEAAPRNAVLTVRRIPEQPMPLLVAPENSKGKYLLPVYDLRAGRVGSEEEKEK